MKPLVYIDSSHTSWHLGGKRTSRHVNSKFHREDGPAVEYADGTVMWWLNDRLMSREEHAEAVKAMKAMKK